MTGNKDCGGNRSMQSLNKFAKFFALAAFFAGTVCANSAWADGAAGNSAVNPGANPGAIQGVVKGADGKAVPGAYVKLTDGDGLTLLVTSGGQGKFSANNLKPG